MIALRPLGLGELIDRAIGFWRSHWRLLFKLVIGFQLVEHIAIVGAQGLGRWLFPLARDPAAIRDVPQQAGPQALGLVALLTFGVLLSLAVAQVAGVALSWFAWSRVTGRGEPTAGDAFRHAASRLGSTLGAWALSLGWTALVSVPLLLPSLVLAVLAAIMVSSDGKAGAVVLAGLAGVAAVLGLIVLVLWFVIRFMLVSQIIAVESKRAWETFRRADALSSGRLARGALGLVKVRLTVLITVLSAVLIIVSLVTSLPLLIAGGVYGASFQPGNTVEDVVPAVVLMPIQLAQTLLGALISPLYVMFQLYFYVDMRVRREGLDLELALGATPP